jgi:hypothetical protein
MSHIAEVELEMKDMGALAKAAEACGMELVRDAKTFKYYAGQTAPCIHKLKLKGAGANDFEVGLRYTDGTQTTVAPFIDTYGHAGQKLVKAMGEGMVKLKQHYAAEVTRADLKKKGYRVTVTEAEGRLRVRATK